MFILEIMSINIIEVWNTSGWTVQHCIKIPFRSYIIIIIIIIIIIGIQPLGRFEQRPELSQETGMALVRCTLGKFLRVVCHCFPPRLDFPLSPPGVSTSSRRERS